MAEPELQFDRAQFDVPTETACAFCRRSLSGSYFEVNGKLACELCRMKAEEIWNQSSGVPRFLRACVFGTVAAALGAALYYAVREVTGYEISLISIAVGWMVGVSVRVGSNRRGGLPYQLLAIFLTYSSIVGTYAPLVIQGLRQNVKATEASKTPSSAPAAVPNARRPCGQALGFSAPDRSRASGGDRLCLAVSDRLLIGRAGNHRPFHHRHRHVAGLEVEHEDPAADRGSVPPLEATAAVARERMKAKPCPR
jgi:hypothetical protein